MASGGTDKRIIIWNVDGGVKLKEFIGHHDTVTSLDYDLETQHLWSVAADRTVRIWDVFNGRQLKNVKRHSDLISCIKLLKKRKLVITGSWD